MVVNNNVTMGAIMGPRFGVEADNITMDANAAIAVSRAFDMDEDEERRASRIADRDYLTRKLGNPKYIANAKPEAQLELPEILRMSGG